MKQKALATRRALQLLSSLLFAMMIGCVCSAQGQTDTTKQPEAAVTQKTDFAVGRNPDAIVFDGANIWVANQLGDSVMKLSAHDGTILGTFPTGNKPVALAYDGENIWVANKFSHNV